MRRLAALLGLSVFLLACAPALAQTEPSAGVAAISVEPTVGDVATAVAAKAWPLLAAVLIFLGTKALSSLGWVTGKGGKLVLVGLQAAAAAAFAALQLGQHWALASLSGLTAGLAAVGIFSGGKNAAQALRR